MRTILYFLYFLVAIWSTYMIGGQADLARFTTGDTQAFTLMGVTLVILLIIPMYLARGLALKLFPNGIWKFLDDLNASQKSRFSFFGPPVGVLAILIAWLWNYLFPRLESHFGNGNLYFLIITGIFALFFIGIFLPKKGI